MAVVDASALVMTGTRADPRREVLGRWKRRRRGADFRNDLLRRIDPEPRHGRQALHRILMDPQERGELIVQLLLVRVEHLELGERHRHQLAWASSRSAARRFWNWTRLRVSWYFRRVTVRQRRCVTSGTKLRVSSCATSRLTRRSASGKSRLRPWRP